MNVRSSEQIPPPCSTHLRLEEADDWNEEPQGCSCGAAPMLALRDL